MPPKHKRHDKTPDRRNETGLAAPGRKVHKQRSNGHLNAPSSASVSTLDAAPSLKDIVAPDHPRTNFHDGTPANSTRAVDASNSSLARHTQAMPPFPAANDPAADRSSDEASRSRTRADTVDSRPDSSLYAAGALDTSSISTVIQPHSMRDVVAILLLLLQLPPRLLIFVQACFAFLTLGSFAGTGLNLSSLTAALEWFQGRGETPTSFISTLVCDLAFTFVWLCIPWGRNFTLDIAQIVMAVSLGGGAASHGGGWTLPIFCVCLSLLGCSHVFRHDAPRQHVASLFRTIASRSNVLPLSIPMSIPDLAKSAAAGHPWPRAVLELHIITQGISRIVRRVFMNNTSTAQASPAKRLESETQSQTLLQVPSITTSHEVAADGSRSLSTDGRPPGLPPAARDNREKSISSGKKRRKQATYVRSQQPFWAAIASTKVTVSKEMEQSQASRDSYEAGATSIKDLGGLITSSVEDRVWIVRVEDTEVEFEACLQCPSKGKRKLPGDSESTGCSVDTSELQVRVNDADWASATFRSSRTTDKTVMVKGRIHGLTALTEYEISFIRQGEEPGLVCTMALLTRQGPSDEIGSSTAVQAPQLQGKLSPGSTVKQAIATAERDLNEAKNRSKKIRREHKNTSSALLKEVGHFKDRLQTFGGTDGRQRQREIQFRQNIRQAEEAAAEISVTIENLGPIPEDELLRHQACKKDWESAREHRRGMRQDYDGVKAECDRRVSTARGENQSVALKREKLQTRLQRLDLQRDELELYNSQSLEARARQARDRKALQGAREIQERNYHQQIMTLEAQTSDIRFRTSQFESQLHQLENPHAVGGQGFGYQMPAPHTPESTFAALRNGPPFASPFGPQQHHYPVGSGTPPISSRRGSLVTKSRERKSSMLSDASGFTDDALDDHANHVRPGPLSHDSYAAMRNNSEGSGSSGSMAFVQANGYGTNSVTTSGSASGGAGSSRRDSPASPTMGAGNVAGLSPISAGIGRASPRHHANGNGGK